MHTHTKGRPRPGPGIGELYQHFTISECPMVMDYRLRPLEKALCLQRPLLLHVLVIHLPALFACARSMFSRYDASGGSLLDALLQKARGRARVERVYTLLSEL